MGPCISKGEVIQDGLSLGGAPNLLSGIYVGERVVNHTSMGDAICLRYEAHIEVYQGLFGGISFGFFLRTASSFAASCAINLYGQFTQSTYAEALTLHSRHPTFVNTIVSILGIIHVLFASVAM